MAKYWSKPGHFRPLCSRHMLSTLPGLPPSSHCALPCLPDQFLFTCRTHPKPCPLCRKVHHSFLWAAGAYLTVTACLSSPWDRKLHRTQRDVWNVVIFQEMFAERMKSWKSNTIIWWQILLIDYTHMEASVPQTVNIMLFGRQRNSIGKDDFGIFVAISWVTKLVSGKHPKSITRVDINDTSRNTSHHLPSKAFYVLIRVEQNIITHWFKFNPAQNYIIFNGLLDKNYLKIKHTVEKL